MSQLRLFFAIELPRRLKDAAGQLQASLKSTANARIGWVRPETLHLTLRFLGDTPEEQVPALISAVEEALAPLEAFEVELAGGGSFVGRRKRPRVLWLGARSGGALERTAEALSRGLETAGIPPEDRPFRSHLTIGRVKNGDARPEARSLDEVGRIGSFQVGEVVLFSSDLQPTGAVHTALARVRLRA